MKDECPICHEIGIISLSKIREKPKPKIRRSRTFLHGLGDYKKSNYPDRGRTRYFRVHHYIYDKNGDYVRGENGRPKSKFCYIGSFEHAFKHFKNCKNLLEKYHTSAITEEAKKNEWLIWESSEYEYMKDMYEQGKKIDIENLKHNDIDLINKIIRDSQHWIIRNDKVCASYI